MTTKTCDNAVNHVIERLASVLGLLLCESEHRSELVKRQLEIIKPHGCFHQFKVSDSSVRSLAQFAEQVAASYSFKGYADALALTGQFDALLYAVRKFGGQHGNPFREHITGEHLQGSRHLVAESGKQTAATIFHVWQLHIVQRTVHLLYLFADSVVFLLHLFDGLQIVLADSILLSLRHAVVLHRQLLDGALIIIHLAFGGLGF